ncbi:hypothetical protein EEB12_29635 [Rhodococcus sp. WS1]|uniref:hypothetical protein n=1 Tax=unclassified Rhodococcus (in: high G+C Gram-positive bacteria) TaxID=192944 RepID=UPI001141FDAF|nr:MULTISPECIES: hypothetical protein [unclassified Rhodococcus (in: high G+C Gram-positive bacteria)]ROZ52975.1 hypothetical protein EEB12_29635 [Rhodococcus sp. WS1]TQC36067.1 hypothetical protein EEB16_21205 [Rhodococcus sp. WS7]
MIWLREDSQLIADLVEGRGLDSKQEAAIREGRDKIDRQIKTFKGADAQVAVHTIDCESVGPGPDERRGPRWQRSFRLAREAVERVLGDEYKDIIEPHLAKMAVKQNPDPIEKCLIAIEKCLIDWLGKDSLN